jgi:membrane associated rhomboid family serine protease
MVITLIGWIPIPVPAMLFLVVWILLQVVGASAGVGAVGSGGGGVAYFAHVGGFAFGLLTVKLFDRGVPP